MSDAKPLPRPLAHLRLPVIGAPMFIISNPELTLAQCKAGIVGAFPSLNARPATELDAWLARIVAELEEWNTAHPLERAGPFAVNLIVHRSNDRLAQDLELCVKWKVPIVITSLGARPEVNEAVHAYGGVVLHDVISNEFARKAIEKGADGLILVAAGAGGHAGTWSPFALVEEVRRWFAGPVALAGAIATGRSILAALACGADLAYVGSAFIATREANAPEAYKRALIGGTAADIVYTDLFTGVRGNYLRSSIAAAGLDPDRLPQGDPSSMSFSAAGATAAKAWRDVWGCGQGLGAIDAVVSAAELIGRLAQELTAARGALARRLPPA
ncbi:MAG TPA: nitronate monooxygenase family protein [Steroidobacteraceae bacterium]|nr:nitronate monooxygenase family protein [Steroidobacteraceae bacterium]